ncbi:MAG: Asp-tRNA(Asn)/Glu-tRNA(Gln) amidotransferase subunit GatA [Flavobacteriales bacterium]|nr:Asp-tRNA(Asn)/Glu-tRNA(Gln) amidotransferase subunit GatA [Flavobacteriia bacterium]NCP06776.1 Asp-tRNA(Asn)/Glu-tRNA(Gln) amidotransferase subunit GatA [Flavobacteriales bacterium]PIV92383.1 MAG: Asp-tRNA(Asn)/Glu-tRNA(Gln) amidotransferase subunit GatA [Flavobacteriaceae bacterium CG17_big_fil_post_rev_8_21_14_2_50_33_15]PIY11221.1 MAG: Asp-tRNA(Asn)/Glu-tRNA(Gln) amidotransferase subunit GatA [Flavobacteriaceae bacterium CG_4_10_14_3_um_filter_33_47]PJB20324.1 MAG: Asp-tRNA(Asn)/Glu-tRNA(
MDSQIKQIHQQLMNKDISCVKLVQERLDLLKANTNNTVNSLLDTIALQLAAKVDTKIANGETIGILEGIPFGIKDVYMLQGTYTTASSNLLKYYKSAYTATAIQKLLDVGAIPIVKENCDSFGHGSSSENTIFGAVKNAINPDLVGGGSSGGSAVNVAKDYTVFSIGGDTGGSVRQPAGYNHVYGLKPTYGRISRYGLMAYASSTDCVGPIAKSVEDIRLVLNVMSGKDVKDQTTYASAEISESSISNSRDIKTIGYFKNFIESEAIDPDIKADFLASIEKIKAKGIKVKELDFFKSDILVSTYYTLAMAETASNLSRLDGSNYGNRIEDKNLKESYAITRSENFSEETKRRIVGGNQVLSQGFSDEIYLKGLALRDSISENFKKDFEEVDIILSPVTPATPPKIGESLKDPLAMYLSDAYTVGFSLGQLPTLTIPQGTETGLQITAAKNNDELVLKFANFLKDTI